MTWVGLRDQQSGVFASTGLGHAPDARPLVATGRDALMPRGSIVVETRISPGRRPQPLIRFDRQHGGWPMHLSLQAIPGGGITLVLNQAGAISHASLNKPQTGRLDTLRISYCWDAPARIGWLTVERTDSHRFLIAPIASPRPLRVSDARALIRGAGECYVSPDVVYVAISTEVEPVGPMPSLAPDTPVATPHAYVPAGSLRRGDTVLTAAGEAVPILHSFTRTVPARGHFRPVRMRAPYFGLQQDIVVAPFQRLVISGSVVDYMFGTEAVLVNACHLIGGTSAVPADCGPVVTYTQLLLPGHEALMAAGSAIESLYVGRLRRDRQALGASILSGLDRAHLPEHGESVYPVLRAFDALVLAEQRAA